MKIYQKEIVLSPKKRGLHLITEEVNKQIQDCQIKTGLANVFIQHTSAGLTINENADPSVRQDFANYMDKAVPEDTSYFIHTYEGPDDMPAHIKSSLMGFSISVPITNSSFNLGTWQGIYLCEFRNHGGSRKIVITITGE